MTRLRTSVIALALVMLATGCSGEPSSDVTLPRDPASAAAGKVLFEANCAQCHGTDLRGGRGPNLVTRTGRDDASMRVIIQRGRGVVMPAYAEVLTDDEINSIIDYVRTVQADRLSQ